MALSSLIACLFAIPLVTVLSCEDKQCSQAEQGFQMCGLFILRFFANFSYTFFYLLKNEVFPSQIRMIAMQLTSIFSKLAIMLVPTIQQLMEAAHLSIIWSFLTAAFLIGLLSLTLPETLGTNPP